MLRQSKDRHSLSVEGHAKETWLQIAALSNNTRWLTHLSSPCAKSACKRRRIPWTKASFPMMDVKKFVVTCSYFHFLRNMVALAEWVLFLKGTLRFHGEPADTTT
eukprot:1136159-Pelagomonas_calceolata.AAC.2